VILLDTRYFRSPLKKRSDKASGEGPYEANPDPNCTILGEAQWRWLGEQLRKPARVRLLCTSIQIVPQDHHWEKWMNFPHERERLFAMIRATKAAGVIALSGDRHLAELSMMDADIGYPLYDLTSSGLTQANAKWRKHEVNRHRVMTMNFGNNFGMIDIDWSAKPPLIRLQIRDEHGEVTIQQKIPLSVLQPSAARINGQPLSAAEVKQLLNKQVTLEMTVAATGMSGKAGLVFLNSHADRKDPDNFTVVLDKNAQSQLAKAGIANPREHFDGKSIRVAGVLSLFREQPQIIVSSAAQIQVVK
jgi:alkaline phosphatase D